MLMKLGLVLCGIIIALFLSEGIVRYFKLAPATLDDKMLAAFQFVRNPKICFKMRPFAHKGINAEGFRDAAFSIQKPPETVRIIMLGDSITFGANVRQEETFSEVLERMLNAQSRRLSGARRYDVMNFGMGGYNIVSEVGVLEEIGLKYKPDVVVLNYFWNDNDMYSFDYWRFLSSKDISLVKRHLMYEYYVSPDRFNLMRFLFRSHLFVYCWAIKMQLQKRFMEFNDVRYRAFKHDVVREKLLELRTMGEKHGFKLLICMHPILDYDRKKTHPHYATTMATADALKIPWVDLLPYYQKESPDPRAFLVVEKDVFHPNVLGHRLVARALMLNLEKMGFIVPATNEGDR